MKKGIKYFAGFIIVLLLAVGGGTIYYFNQGNKVSQESNKYTDEAISIENNLTKISEDFKPKFEEIANSDSENIKPETLSNFQKYLSDYSVALNQEVPKIPKLKDKINVSQNSQAYQATSALKKYLKGRNEQLQEVVNLANGFGCYFNAISQITPTLQTRQAEVEESLKKEPTNFAETATFFQVQSSFYAAYQGYFTTLSQCNRPTEAQVLPSELVTSLNSISEKIAQINTAAQEGVVASQEENNDKIKEASEKLGNLGKDLESGPSLDSFNSNIFDLKNNQTSENLKNFNSEIEKLSNTYIFASFNTIVEKS